jgi:1,4-alpha-glucan branching enzyme
MSLLTADDLHLFNEGRHLRLYDHLGAHLVAHDAAGPGCEFAVWAPNARSVSVMGDFNGWDAEANQLSARDQSGIWEGFVPGAALGQRYVYRVVSRHNGYQIDKADPLAFYAETPPRRASVIWDLDYTWNDSKWLAERKDRSALTAPISIYEVHLGSWMRVPEDGDRSLGYRELAPRLCEYVRTLGFTHVELLPVMEHPFYGSWGYQVTGFFAPTSRYGTPQDLMFLIDALHQAGIGVLLDWVPSHFPADGHGLGYFDGTHLYEHMDPRQGFHPEWRSLLFNYGRKEVQSFLLSSALFWLDRYHLDGLRVDGVASMLYLDYGRRTGEWVPNAHGGHENLDAIHFLRTLNEEVYRAFPDVQTIAEESTAFPGVTRPTSAGGLGFGLKWDMGWMHDTRDYLARDPVHRRHHHSELTFRMMYASTENFVLPLSHDEVVHLKESLLTRMSGDPWQKRANLRLLFAYQFTQPGKKLLFMGGEFGQEREWNHDQSLDWHLMAQREHAGLWRCVRDLAHLYRGEPALHRGDCQKDGFRWLDPDDQAHSVLCFLRRVPGEDEKSAVVVALNFTPVPRPGYRIGVPAPGCWLELFNTDASDYGGSGLGNLGGVVASEQPHHGQPASIEALLPPLAMVMFKLAPQPGR